MAEVKVKSKIKNSARRRMFSPVKVIIGFGILILVLSAGAWIVLVRNTPENAFEGMLENGFRTASVTRQVDQLSGTQKLNQIIRTQNQSEHVAWGYTTLTQDNGSTKVVTESIGTSTADYVRYIEIKTDQKNASGKQLEFGKVLNVWGKNETADGSAIGELYGDTSLGLFLFADLPANQRNQMLELIQKNGVYTTDYATTKRVTKNGRPYFIYRVSIKPSAYITMLKQYGEFVGIKQLSSLDPSAYEKQQPQEFDVAVDVISQRLTKVTTVSGNRQETYSGYGIIQEIKLPTESIPLPDLQERLQASASA